MGKLWLFSSCPNNFFGSSENFPPFVISGSRGLITGFDEGIRLVGEGGKAIIYIPSDLAYGPRGNRGIEPNTVLIFDIEVVKVGKFVPQEVEVAE